MLSENLPHPPFSIINKLLEAFLRWKIGVTTHHYGGEYLFRIETVDVLKGSSGSPFVGIACSYP